MILLKKLKNKSFIIFKIVKIIILEILLKKNIGINITTKELNIVITTQILNCKAQETVLC
jgi:hypothetical protein